MRVAPGPEDADARNRRAKRGKASAKGRSFSGEKLAEHTRSFVDIVEDRITEARAAAVRCKYALAAGNLTPAMLDEVLAALSGDAK